MENPDADFEQRSAQPEPASLSPPEATSVLAELSNHVNVPSRAAVAEVDCPSSRP